MIYYIAFIVTGCAAAVSLAVRMALVRRRHATETALGDLYSQYLLQIERQATVRLADSDDREWLADLEARAQTAAQARPQSGRWAQRRDLRKVKLERKRL